MTSTNETGPQIINVQTAWYRLFSTFFGSFLFFFGTALLMDAIYEVVPAPPTGSIVNAIPWFLVMGFALLAIFRNDIINFIFGKISHSSFLSLVHFGRIVNYILIISSGSFFLIGILVNTLIKNEVLFIFSLGIISVWVSLTFVFSGPLTYAGEIRLLFELLTVNLSNYENRQPYLRTISKKVENQLKVGNIKVPQYEFVYYFNMELLNGINVQNDLRNIESWLVDKENPCFESLKRIYPENKFEPWRRTSLFRQFTENPAIIKYTSYVVLAIILIAISPDLRSEILRLFSGLP
jgi:hypothetical protein